MLNSMHTFRAAGFSPARVVVVVAVLAALAAAGPLEGQPSGPPYLVLDANPGTPSSSPGPVVVMNGIGYFAAEVPATGRELWRTDGTAAGTYMVRDLAPGSASSKPDQLTVIGNVLFFQAWNNTSGWQLWKTDGTSAGTTLLRTFTNQVGSPIGETCVVGTTLFFVASDAEHGPELWKSDGTAPGTVMVKDIKPGPLDFTAARPRGLTAFGDIVLFSANDGASGQELWRSDGTESGTVMVKDIDPRPQQPSGNSSSPFQFAVLGAEAYFWATEPEHGTELWKTDGTTEGTVLVKDIVPGPDSGLPMYFPFPTPSAGRLFFVAVDPVFGQQLFVSDGSAEGTRVASNFTPALPRGEPWAMVDLAGVVLFSASTEATGRELWRSDGTPEGTVLVRDIFPGPASSSPYKLRVLAGELYFEAIPPLSETALWRSDGTMEGTVPVGDINPGGAAWPEPFAEIDGLVLLSAFQEATGMELWAVPVNRSPVAAAGPDQVLDEGSEVSLDASSSSDPDGDPLAYEWRDGAGTLLGTQAILTLTPPLGTHDFTLTVSDGRLSDSDEVQVEVADLKQVTITITGADDGAGSVQTDPASAGCASSAPPATCVLSFPAGTSVSLSAQPVTGSSFQGWTGACSGTATCVISLSDDVGVQADFLGPRRLTVSVSSIEGGTGWVSIDPPGAFCALAPPETMHSCIETYSQGEVVTLSAVSGPESVFAGWTGACTGTEPCQLPMIQHEGVTASFLRTNHPPLASAGGPYAGVRGQPVAFDGTGSSDPEGDPLSYQWTFGDGATGVGPTPSHAYSTLGTFAVTLVVSDAHVPSAPASATVTITNLPPGVALASPADGTVVTWPASVPLAAVAGDPDGSIARVEFFAAGVKVGEATSPPYGAVWTAAAPGAYLLTARATDDSGASADSAPVSVVVDAAPSVSFTAPAPGTLFITPATIGLEAAAADTDGTIARVEFFLGTASLGVTFGPPYAVTWANAPAGLHIVTAVATDDRGATSIASLAVSVVVVVTPLADAFVREKSPSTNYGARVELEVRRSSSSNDNRWSYLQFDTSAVAAAASVRLRLFGAVSGTTSATVRTEVLPVADTSWAETTLTWNNKPAPGASALATVTVASNSTTPRWYEWDVTAYVQQEKAAGRHVIALALRNDAHSNPYVQYNSRQSTANRPELVLVP